MLFAAFALAHAAAPPPADDAAALAAAHAGDWKSARVLTSGSIQGRYLLGVAEAKRKNYPAALAAFEEVLRLVQAHHRQYVPEARAAELDRARDLAILGVARVLFAAGKWAEAVPWYDRVPRTSPEWPRAQVEAAWSELGIDDAQAWKRLRAVRGLGAWQPDLPWLELALGDQLRGPIWTPCSSLPPKRRPIPPEELAASDERAHAEVVALMPALNAVAEGAPFETLPPHVRAALEEDPTRVPLALEHVREGFYTWQAIYRADVIIDPGSCGGGF